LRKKAVWIIIFPYYDKGVKEKMKRKFLALTMLLSVSLVLGACGEKDTSESTLLSETSIVSENSSEGETSASETSASDTETVLLEKEENKPVVEASGDNAKLYNAFIEGTEKAEITKSGDHGAYYSFTGAMNVGESYTINEIIEKLSTYMKENGWEKAPTLGAVNHEYIDCGQDGNPELHVQIELPVDDIEPFVVDMIVAVKDGHLVVAYNGDSWSRNEVTIDETGCITSSGADGAASIVFDTGFVNAAGDYVHGYKGRTAMGLVEGDFYLDVPTDLSSIDLRGIPLDGIMLEEISFEENATVADTYIMLYDGLASGEAGDPSSFDESHPLRQAFEKAGFKIITFDELNSLTVEKMAAKGYVTK